MTSRGENTRRHVSLFMGLLVSLTLSCTSTVGDGSPPTIDATPVVDSTQPDAKAPGARDGEPCQRTNEDDSGGCAKGYTCMRIDQGPGRCRQICPTLQLACVGYEGPGYSLCALKQNDDNGQAIGNACLIVCGDEFKTLRGCDDGACDGNCPGEWTCQNDVLNAGLQSCQAK